MKRPASQHLVALRTHAATAMVKALHAVVRGYTAKHPEQPWSVTPTDADGRTVDNVLGDVAARLLIRPALDAEGDITPGMPDIAPEIAPEPDGCTVADVLAVFPGARPVRGRATP